MMLDARANTHAAFYNGLVYSFTGIGSSGESHYFDLKEKEWRDLDRKFESLTNAANTDLHNNPGCFIELS